MTLEILYFGLGFAGVVLGLYLISLLIDWYVFKTEWILRLAVNYQIEKDWKHHKKNPDGTTRKMTFKEAWEHAKKESEKKANLSRDSKNRKTRREEAKKNIKKNQQNQQNQQVGNI